MRMTKYKNYKNFFGAGWLIVCVLCAAMLLAGCGNAQDNAQNNAQDDDTISDTVLSAAESAAETDENALPPVSEEISVEQDVKNYLDIMALSRASLIELLVYDGFSESDAEAAVDNAGIDWNEQAARQARSYLDTMEYTRDELIDQLEYDKFSHEEAVYGVDHCDAAWN